MNSLPFSTSNKWKCPKCSVSNANTSKACALCGTSQPTENAKAKAKADRIKKENDDLMKTLYSLINALHVNQKKQLIRIIEDKF